MKTTTFLASTILSISLSKLNSLATTAQQFRSLIHQSQDRAILLPGVHDALSAKIFEQQGAECLFLSGFGVSASYLGSPDAGLLTLTEMEDVARRVISATTVPAIVDSDTGFGSCSNLRRAVRVLGQAGTVAVTIEDQVFPKKCTYSAGEKGCRVVSREASMARIRTALAASKEAYEKDGNEVIIIARSDCRASLGLEEAMSRCLAYEALGAEIVYAENLQSPDEYANLREVLSSDTTTILAQVQLNDAGQTQKLYSLPEIHDLGYNFALMGVTALQATVKALQVVAQAMLQDDNHQGLVPPAKSETLSSFSQLKTIVGFPELEDFERDYYCE